MGTSRNQVIFLPLVLLSLFLAVSTVMWAERLPVKIYTTADGLARNTISRIVRDSRGFLWFCTSEGVSRFDGYKFSNYGTDQGLPHRNVNDLLETRSGTYWVATSDGLSRFDPSPSSASRFTTYRPSGDKGQQVITALLEDRAGTVWVGTGNGLYRLEQVAGSLGAGAVQFHFVDLGMPRDAGDDSSVNVLLEDRRGVLWVGTESGVYGYWPDGHTQRYTTRHGLPSKHIKALLEDREGGFWVGTVGGLCRLVAQLDPNRPIVARRYTTKEGLSHNWVTSLVQSADGKLWIGTVAGLNQFIPGVSEKRSQFRSYGPAHGLSDSHVRTLTEDRDGNLWIGGETGGAMKIARNGLTTYTQADGLGHTRIRSIFENKAGELCVISHQLLINRFDGTRFQATWPNLPQRVTDFGWGWHQITLQDHTGEWWVPTAQGLYRFPKVSSVDQLARTAPKAVYTTREGMPGNFVFRLFEDSRGDVWISTDKLTRWERATETFHSYSETETWATAFREDGSGNLWMGFYGGGVARYRNDRFTLFTRADGVPPGLIHSIHLDRNGVLWVATSRGGLGRIHEPGTDHPRFVTYTTAQGLSGNEVTCVTDDQWGRIYVGTGRGVDRLDPASGRIKHYTTADGLARDDVVSAFHDRQGTLWFGTAQGLSKLLPEPERHAPPPPIRVSELRIGGLPYPVSELGETELRGLVLQPNQNQIQIDFAGLNFSAGEVLRYQYRLEGVDQEWSPLTDQRTVNYVRLSPGRYRFQVRVVNSDGLASTTPALIAFRVLPPLWQRWWFLALATMLVSLLIYAIHRYRVARLLELERVRTRIATDLHDDIGSGLSQIAILSEVVRQQAGEQDAGLASPLARIASVSRELVDSMGDIVWAINPQKDHVRDLTQRMRRFASDVFAAGSIELTFSCPTSEPEFKLGADLRRQVFLVFKETVNNIARHSDCKRVQVEFSVQGQQVLLRLNDDGKGFDPAQARDGHGLKSMDGRARSLGGKLEVTSRRGQGTTVTLRVPSEHALLGKRFPPE